MSTESDATGTSVEEALTDYFEAIFPGRSPVAETHAGAVLSLLRSAPPEEVAQALGWQEVGSVAVWWDDAFELRDGEEPGPGLREVVDEDGDRWEYAPEEFKFDYLGDPPRSRLIEESVRPVFAPPLGEKKEEGE